MYVWIIGGFAVLISGMVGYMLQHPRTVQAPVVEQIATTTPLTATSTPVTTDTTGVFTLALGETGESHGWKLTPMTLVEDSRCPTDVQCIQAGTVRVSVRVQGAITSDHTLTLIDPERVDGGRVTLLKVEPTPSTKNPLKKSDYRFTFLVENL